MILVKINEENQSCNFLVIIKDQCKLFTKSSRIIDPFVEPFLICSKQSEKRVDMVLVKINGENQSCNFLELLVIRPP
jgi:hypothetical protein